ncbi:hypothetical protein CSE16_01625 [Solibacillus sp. R5-41]|uniref:hypothetical protein n=1 Tax=Solibacillus sp. R5-41 TaxID=2048654 RepID=UPI000C125587|nr:hypothetical protein [Solibacillus sp. R5-41]ATP38816.1 hypothetical protein CSE16_01625 [Solibacillus sp. R5-41]
MGNVYSAQNVAAYIIYELNDLKKFVNAMTIQEILADVELMWQKVFGHCAFSETTYHLSKSGYVVKEIAVEYKEHGVAHILVPAKEWYLKYGEFQLVQRPFAIPNYTVKEQLLMKKIISIYHLHNIERVKVAV